MTPFIECLPPLLFFFFFLLWQHLALLTSTAGDVRYRISCCVAKERTIDLTVSHDLDPQRLGGFLKTV